MAWVDIHNVGCGECIVLNSGQNMLMTDCGSLNTCLPSGQNFKEYVQQSLTERYSGVPYRAFLLSHFHRDHVCGLWDILSCQPDYFSEIYLPCSPCDERGLPLLLEFALFAYAFLPRQGYCGQVSTSALKAFSRALRRTEQGCVYALGQGDTFVCGSVTYECLWPPRENFPFDDDFVRIVEQLHRAVMDPDQPGGNLLQNFLDDFYEFCNQYLEFCKEIPVSQNAAERAQIVLDRISAQVPHLAMLPAAEEVCNILESRTARDSYSRQTNAASLLFQNVREGKDSTDDVLFTGDATPETMEEVEPLLYRDYYLLKVPHHGLPGALSPVLTAISAEHIVVSGGEVPGSGARPAVEWAAAPGMKHCTAPVCSFLSQESSGCCRTAVCPTTGRLALRCPGNRGGDPPCGIRVLGSTGRGCICDLSAREQRFW
ncbi:hypothetical protein [Caproicibacterium lactatifermentans]|jgi:hypothetical protein|uniref:Metallo-beta-lactamase domain-containing protein n=1 Tax=Caproicibacterium lactatifermentans TaxID=2666138 RepID=A0ABX6PUW6_9FIRM|nr:hypothetical protein [Caproicibacterium lactatifermentans]MDD4807146.1 hypothetical protein [Oscillospiraceae bacterium]QKO30055.1 hypothetical protein GKP14_02930 [Caproicibacterium lactatifermentans]